MTEGELKTALRYDPETGVFERRASGQVVGTLDRGYIRIGIGRRQYYAHRLAWLYVHGEFPPGLIDHIDVDKTNNRISNLRLATRSQQQWNTRRPRRNTSGVKGVSWHAPAQKWYARIRINGGSKHLGYFSDRDQAAAAYAAAAAKAFGEYARTDEGGSK